MCAELFNYSPSSHVIGKKIAVYSGTAAPIIQIEGDFTYDEEGRLSSITYPNSFDTMGRPFGMSQGTTTIASSATFNPAGQLTAVNYASGNGTSSNGTELRTYNALNQLTSIELGDTIDKSYLYATGKNNGQITQTKDGITGESISYSYDSLKRLSSASATTLPHILNRSFEEISTPYWILSSNAQISPVSPHSGPYSLHILSDGGYSNPSGDNLPCIAGTTYTISGWYKLDPQQTGGVSVTANGAAVVTLTLTPQATWTQFSTSYKPTNCTGGQVAYFGLNYPEPLNGTPPPGTMWLDDLSITSSGQPNSLLNPGFETETSPSWNASGSASASMNQVHEAALSMLPGQSGNVTQTVGGGIPSTSYTVTGYYSRGLGTDGEHCNCG